MSEQRRDHIAAAVTSQGRVSLGDLATAVGVSEMTVRRDLDELTRRGVLQRVRGGAVAAGREPTTGLASGSTTRAPLPPTPPVTGLTPGPPLARPAPSPASSPRLSPGSSPAGALARASAAVLDLIDRTTPASAAPTLLLDAGPAAEALARALLTRTAGTPHERAGAPPALTVVATSLAVATLLAHAPGIDLVVAGGQHRAGAGDGALHGPLALAALAGLHVDHVVLTPAGVHPTFGLSTTTPEAAAWTHAALGAADHASALVGAAAVGARALVASAAVAALDHLVVAADTEQAAAAASSLAELRARGVDVHLP